MHAHDDAVREKGGEEGQQVHKLTRGTWRATGVKEGPEAVGIARGGGETAADCGGGETGGGGDFGLPVSIPLA